MRNFKAHGQRILTFRQAHPASQDVAVAERESFQEHDEQMKEFCRHHPVFSTLTTTVRGCTWRSLNLVEWSAIIPMGNMKYRFSQN